MAIIQFDYTNDNWEDFRVKLNQISNLFGDGDLLPLNETDLVSAMVKLVNTQNASPNFLTNTIEEYTINSGVTVDGVLIKDFFIRSQKSYINSTSPELFFVDSDGLTNEKIVSLVNNSKIFSIGILGDNELSRKNFIEFNRIGNDLSDIKILSNLSIENNVLSFRNNSTGEIKNSTSLDHIWFDTSSKTFNFCDTASFRGIGNSTVQLQTLNLRGTPSILFNEISQSANNKLWKLSSNSSKFTLQTLSDTLSSKDILEIQRSGNNSPLFVYRGNSLQVKSDNMATLILESSLNSSSTINFNEDSNNRANIFFDKTNNRLTIEKKSLSSNNVTNKIEINDSFIETSKDIFLQNRSIVFAYTGTSPENSSSVHSLWYDNNTVNSINGNLSGTWHFQSGLSNRSSGNSLLKCSSLNTENWIELWNRSANANNGKYRFVSRTDSKFTMYIQNDASTEQTEVFTINRAANIVNSFDISTLLKVNSIETLNSSGVLVSNIRLNNGVLSTNTISEFTSNSGVTIDGTLLKDGGIITTLDVKSDTINERTAGSGVTIDGTLLKDGGITAFSDIKTNIINERTNNSGVTIDGILLKDGGIALSGTNLITGTSSLNFLIDSDNNETSRGFGFYNNTLANNTAIFTIQEAGSVQVYCQTADPSITIADVAANGVLANPFISFNRCATVDGVQTRMGLIGVPLTTNEDFHIRSDALGSFIIFSNANVDIHLDDDNNGSNNFNIYNGGDTNIFNVQENGTVNATTYNGVNANITNLNTIITTSSTTNTTNLVTSNIDLNGTMKSLNGQVASANVVFNGVGTPTILKGYNIASINRLGTGEYRINFTNAFSDNNYAFTLNSLNNGAFGQYFIANIAAKAVTANYIDIRVLGDNGGAWNALDLDRISVVIFQGE